MYQINFEWNEDDFYQSNTGISRLPTPELVAEKSEAALQGAVDLIHDIGQRLNESLKTLEKPPSEIDLTFGLRLGAESGIITKDQRGAHLVVRLKWYE